MVLAHEKMEELDKVAETITTYTRSFLHLDLSKPKGETREVWVSRYPARTRSGEVITGKTFGEENYILGKLSKPESLELSFPNLNTLIEIYQNKQARDFRKNVLGNYCVRTNLLIREKFPSATNELDVREVSDARFVDAWTPEPQKQVIENAKGNEILKTERPTLRVIQTRYKVEGPCLQRKVAEKSGGFDDIKRAVPTQEELKVVGKVRWEGIKFEEHLAVVMMEKLGDYTPIVHAPSPLMVNSWHETPITIPIFTTQNPYK